MTNESNTYVIRPTFQQKFNPVTVKEVLRLLLIDELGDKKYPSMDPSQKCKYLGEVILSKLKDLPFQGYKYVVDVVISEQKGQGLKMSALCKWDADTDNCASEFFISEHLICVASVFAVYYY